MYKHIKNYEIRYTDCDVFDALKPSSLLSMMEESACLSADELGFGYDVITPLRMGFILVNWYIELYKPLKLGGKIEIHTWPLKPAHLIFFRDFEIYCGGEKVGVCVTRWCMISLDDFSMLPTSRFFKEGDFDNYNTQRCVEFNSWKIPSAYKMLEEGSNAVDGCAYSRAVSLSDYDHYFHMNNTKYADYLLDVFSLEELRGKFVSKLQITYVKQCKLGEKLDFYKVFKDGAYFVEGIVNGESRVLFKVELSDIKK